MKSPGEIVAPLQVGMPGGPVVMNSMAVMGGGIGRKKKKRRRRRRGGGGE